MAAQGCVMRARAGGPRRAPGCAISHRTASAGQVGAGARGWKDATRRRGDVCTVRGRSPVIPVSVPMGEDEPPMDMMNFLLQNRVVFVGGFLNDELTTQVVGSLMALESLAPGEEIKLYINSPGGSMYNVAGIIDVLESLTSPVSTIAFGTVAHNSTLLLSAGTKGKRFSMPNTRLMMVQPMGGAAGSFVEVNITATELNRHLRYANYLYSKYTGQPVEKIEEETDRERFMSPEQAVSMGIIDGIVGGGPSQVNKQVEELVGDFKQSSAWRGRGE